MRRRGATPRPPAVETKMTDAEKKTPLPDRETTKRLRAETHFLRARGYHRTGRLEEALAALDEAVAADPSFTRARAARGHTLRQLGRLDEALEVITGVLAEEPENAIALATKGTLLQETGRPEEARAAFERALAVVEDEDRGLVHYNFACFWATAGEAEECRRHLARALELEPSKKSVAAVDRDFEKYAAEEWFLALTAL
jgi:Tfp pilus assembly protein PilF